MQVIPHPCKTIRERLAHRHLIRHHATKPVRVVIPHIRGEIDLGTYPNERLGNAAYAAVLPHLNCIDPWPAIWELQGKGIVAPDAYPSHVRAVVEDGRVGYVGKQRVGGDEVETSRMFRQPNTAHVTLGRSVRSLEQKLEAEMNWQRKRFPRSDDLPKYMRRTKGGAIQCRPWLTVFPGFETGVNLGLYSPRMFDNDERAAIAFGRAAWLAFVKAMSGPVKRDVWEVIKELKQTLHMGIPLVRSRVLPPRVKRLPDGSFIGRAKRNGVVVWELGPFETADAAWNAVKAWMRAKIAKRNTTRSRVRAATAPTAAISCC